MYDKIAEQLREYFETFGEIESLSLKMNPNTGKSRGFAFIQFVDEETANKVGSAALLVQVLLLIP